MIGAGSVLNTANVQAGDTVVVFVGSGGVGLNAVQGAVLAGATTIIAVDIADGKLETAETLGATHVVNSTTEDPVEAVRKITGIGANAVFDFLGLDKVTMQSLEMAAPGGGLYLDGRFELDSLVSQEIALDAFNAGKEALKDPSVNRVVNTSF